MSKYEIGDTAVYVEHAVHLRDLDSLAEQAVTTLIRQDDPEPEETACKYAKDHSPENVLKETGNAIEAEYIGPTGRTVLCEFVVLKKGWIKKQELTEDNGSVDLTEYFKMD